MATTTLTSTITTLVLDNDVAAHVETNAFLLTMLHHSWLAVVVICILACFSWNAHRRLRRAQERTVQPDGENGPTSPVSLRSSPGLLAHGSYPFLLRGTLGSVFFVLAVLPLILVIACTLLGLLLAAVEDWTMAVGVEYLLSNVLGMVSPLTDIVPESTGGIHLAILITLLGFIVNSTAMGVIINMSLMLAVAERMPQSIVGFLTAIFLVVPLLMMLVNFLLGCAMAYFEDWSVEDGYLFMAGSMASLANPVTDVETATSWGAFFECLCLSVELCMNGCFLGIVSAHPIINNLCGFLEGTTKDDIADENHTQEPEAPRDPAPVIPPAEDSKKATQNSSHGEVPKVLDELQQRIQAFREARPMVANDLELERLRVHLQELETLILQPKRHDSPRE